MIAKFALLCSLASSHQDAKGEHIATVLPFYSQGGTDTSIASLKKVQSTFIEKAGYKILTDSKVQEIWNEDSINRQRKLKLTPKDYFYDLPRLSKMLEIGRKTKSEIVVAYRAKFHDETAWQGIGPKTKVMVTVDVKIANCETGELELDATNIRMNGSVQQSLTRTAAEILLTTDLVALIGGGPVTPLYEKHGITALSLAMEPWLKLKLKS